MNFISDTKYLEATRHNGEEEHTQRRARGRGARARAHTSPFLESRALLIMSCLSNKTLLQPICLLQRPFSPRPTDTTNFIALVRRGDRALWTGGRERARGARLAESIQIGSAGVRRAAGASAGPCRALKGAVLGESRWSPWRSRFQSPSASSLSSPSLSALALLSSSWDSWTAQKGTRQPKKNTRSLVESL